MKIVSTGYEDAGRSRQKQRTRAALVSSARDLVSRAGSAPTVAEAAAAAGVSRTTAYRYFPNQHALLIAAHPEVDARSMLGEALTGTTCPRAWRPSYADFSPSSSRPSHSSARCCGSHSPTGSTELGSHCVRGVP